MTTFHRRGHFRGNSFVRGHSVTRTDWNNDKKLSDSRTIPHATCPICGADVFYYENENGSKVWFEHLGPPWPIHGCFEVSSKTPKKSKNTSSQKIEIKDFTVKNGFQYIAATTWSKMKIESEIYLIVRQKKPRIENMLCLFIDLHPKELCIIHYFDPKSMKTGKVRATHTRHKNIFEMMQNA